MVFRSLTHRWRIVLLSVFVTFVAFVLVMLLFADSYLKPRLTRKLKAEVLSASDHLYRIDYRKAELHVFQGTAILYDIILQPDLAVYHQLQRKGMSPSMIYELRVKKLTLTGAHAFKLYFHHKLNIGQLVLDRPDVTVSYYAANGRQPTKKADRTLYQVLSKSLRSVRVDFTVSKFKEIYKGIGQSKT